jgi:GT2 family glycosyltransferase
MNCKKGAILITVFNRVNETINCINSLKACLLPEYFSFDIYITDASSTDGTKDIINRMFPDIKVITISQNSYWNSGMILAWENAKQNRDYDFYFLLNNDTHLNSNAFQIILKDYYVSSTFSIVAGVTKESNNNNISYGGRNIINKSPLTPVGTPISVKFINGNFVLIPKCVLKKIGFLNPRFSHSLGDFDFGLRAIKSKVKVLITSQIIGSCELNLNSVFKIKGNLYDRYTHINSPKGIPFKEYFYFNFKYFGIIRALRFIIVFLFGMFFPKLYYKIVSLIT